MKRLILLALLAISLTGCDNRDDKDLIITRGDYVNVTEQWCINTYNGYRCSDYNTRYNETEDMYTVTFEFTNLSPGEFNKSSK